MTTQAVPWLFYSLSQVIEILLLLWEIRHALSSVIQILLPFPAEAFCGQKWRQRALVLFHLTSPASLLTIIWGGRCGWWVEKFVLRWYSDKRASPRGLVDIWSWISWALCWERLTILPATGNVCSLIAYFTYCWLSWATLHTDFCYWGPTKPPVRL